MQKKHCVLLLFLSAIFVTGVNAQLVSIQVFDILDASPCDTKVLEDYPAIEHSVLWETGIMNAFFDGGYIVSSMPVTRSAQTGMQASLLQEAQTAGVEVLVCLYLEYDVCSPDGEIRGPAALRPVALSWEVFHPARSVQSGGVQSWTIQPARNDKEDVRQAEVLGRKIISGLNGR